MRNSNTGSGKKKRERNLLDNSEGSWSNDLLILGRDTNDGFV